MHTQSEASSRLFEFGLDVLSSTLDGETAKDPASQTGTILMQLGDVVSGSVRTQQAEGWYGAPCIVGRPALPQAGKASCQVIIAARGDRWVVIGYRDIRANKIYANLAPGEAAFFATTGQAREIAKKDGSIRQYTTDSNEDAGNAIFAGVSAYYQGTDGQPHLGGEWRVYGPWGGQWMDPTGWHLRTFTGVKIDAGGLTMPAPVSKTIAKFRVACDSIGLDAAIVTLGPASGAQAVVRANDLQTQVAAMTSALQSFGTAVTTFATAVATYAGAIKAIADPTPPSAATTALIAACGVMEVAAATMGNTVTGIAAGLALATGAKSATAS